MAIAVAAVTSRLSWNSAEVTRVLATASEPTVLARTLPSASVAATVGLA